MGIPLPPMPMAAFGMAILSVRAIFPALTASSTTRSDIIFVSEARGHLTELFSEKKISPCSSPKSTAAYNCSAEAIFSATPVSPLSVSSLSLSGTGMMSSFIGSGAAAFFTAFFFFGAAFFGVSAAGADTSAFVGIGGTDIPRDKSKIPKNRIPKRIRTRFMVFSVAFSIIQ